MLRDAYTNGTKAAYNAFGIKEAGIGSTLLNAGKSLGGTASTIGKGVLRGLIGQPKLLAKQLREGTVLKPGGILHGQLWPDIGPNLNPMERLWNLGIRGSTLYAGYNALDALRGSGGDPNEGRLTNALSSAGRSLGMTYGFPAGGLIGGSIGTTGGQYVGKQLGHLLGSKPTFPDLDPSMLPPYQP